MKYMLDTNICIYAIKHKPPEVIRNFLKHDPDDMCISSITYGELMHGVEKSQSVERNRVAITLFLSSIEILPFDAEAAEEYGRVRADLERKGTPIGPMDMLIAGHAKSEGLILVTNNTRESYQKITEGTHQSDLMGAFCFEEFGFVSIRRNSSVSCGKVLLKGTTTLSAISSPLPTSAFSIYRFSSSEICSSRAMSFASSGA